MYMEVKAVRKDNNKMKNLSHNFYFDREIVI